MDLEFAKLCLSGDHAGIIRSLRAKGMRGTQALMEAAKAVKEAIEALSTDPELAKDVAPAKCCLFCVGKCGGKTSRLRPLFVNGIFNGSDCADFVTPESFKDMIPEEKGYILFHTKTSVFRVEFEGGLAAIKVSQNAYRNRTEWAQSYSRFTWKGRRVFTIDKDALVRHLIRKMLKSLSSVKEIEEFDPRLLVNGLPVKIGEKYHDYIDRALDDTRKARVKQAADIDVMEIGDVDAKIKELVEKNGASAVLEGTYGNNIDAFCADFYPGLGKWDVVKEMQGV